MNKFSHLSIINESVENTFLLGKNVNDELPEPYLEISDLFDTLKESYPDTIENISITKGYSTDYNLSRTDRPAHATQVIVRKKIKQYFKDGNIPDKWKLCIRAFLIFKSIEGNSGTLSFDPSVLDVYINRYKSIKTLTSRCSYYGAKVQVSFGSSMNSENISIIVFFN
jgi:hypothetical protein